MVITGKQIVAALATIALVTGGAFAHVPRSSLFPPVSLRVSASPRETRSSAFTNSEGHVYRLGCGLAAWIPITGNYQQADASMQNGNLGLAGFYCGVFVIPNETPLDLAGRIISTGKVAP